jgi:hypothetical protein
VKQEPMLSQAILAKSLLAILSAADTANPVRFHTGSFRRSRRNIPLDECIIFGTVGAYEYR